MGTLQVRLDDELKQKADNLFLSLGLDTPTAVRIFLKASLEHNGIPFSVVHGRSKRDLMQAADDVRTGKNLHGPYNDAESAVRAMMED